MYVTVAVRAWPRKTLECSVVCWAQGWQAPSVRRSLGVGRPAHDALNLAVLPLAVAQRAGGARLEPSLDAVQVEHVAARAPCDGQPRVVRVACGTGVAHTGLRSAAAVKQRPIPCAPAALLPIRTTRSKASSPPAPPLHPPVGLAWYSMLGSYRLLRQMAHVSVQMAQDHLRRGAGTGVSSVTAMQGVRATPAAVRSAVVSRPCSHGHRVPLLDLKALAAGLALALLVLHLRLLLHLRAAVAAAGAGGNDHRMCAAAGPPAFLGAMSMRLLLLGNPRGGAAGPGHARACGPPETRPGRLPHLHWGAVSHAADAPARTAYARAGEAKITRRPSRLASWGPPGSRGQAARCEADRSVARSGRQAHFGAPAAQRSRRPHAASPLLPCSSLHRLGASLQ